MTRLHWESAGSGQPLLLIQGLGYPADMWFRVLPLFTPRFRVLMFDNRGVGANAAVPVDGLTIERMAEDAAEVIAASGEQHVIVVGVSLGGIVAQELVLSHPEVVDRLVLASTHTCDEHGVAADDEVLEMFATRVRLSPDEARRASVQYAYAPGTPVDLIDEDLARRARHPLDPAAYDAQLAAAGLFAGTWERLAAIRHPTLVLHGTDDRIVPPANAEILGARIPSARVQWIPGASHNLFSERAPEFAAAVAEFVPVVSSAR